MTDPSPFGRLLRSLRGEESLTIEMLAERSGVSERTIGDLERGVSKSPHRRTVDALARGLGLDAAAQQSLLRAARAKRGSRARSDEDTILPHRVMDFSGREEEIAAALAILEAPPTSQGQRVALVISGAPGIGKTTGALEILARGSLASSVTVFVGLDGFASAPLTPLQIVTAMLRQLPGAEQKPPADLSSAAAQWRAAVAEHSVSVLLDNAADEAQVRPLLSICATGVVIVTSRRSLAGLEGVRRMRFGPLQRAESVDLLRRLVPQGVASEQGGDDGAWDEVAALCDDIPLALRVVGNRLASRPAWTVVDLLRRLRSTEDRLRMLVAGDLAVDAAISLSYEELDPRTAALFRWISLLDGATFDVRLAAAAVRSADLGEVEFRLDDLTDLGLLEARGGDRYRLHDLLRLFALSRLREAAGADEIERRRTHLREWLLGTLERAGAWFEPGREPHAQARSGEVFADADAAALWIRTESDHWWPAYVDAAARGEHALVMDVADALHWYSDVWLAWGNWNRFFSVAAEAARAARDVRMEALQLGYVAWTQLVEIGDRRAAVDTGKAAVEAARRVGDRAAEGWGLYYIAWALWLLKELDDGRIAAEASVAAFEAAGDTVGGENALLMSTMITNARGDHAAAILDMEAALARSLAGPDPTGFLSLITQYAAFLDLVDAYLAVGRDDDALAAATQGLGVAEALHDDLRVALMRRRRIHALMHMGKTDAAMSEVEEAMRLLGPGSSEAFVFARFRREILAMKAGHLDDDATA